MERERHKEIIEENNDAKCKSFNRTSSQSYYEMECFMSKHNHAFKMGLLKSIPNSNWNLLIENVVPKSLDSGLNKNCKKKK